MRPRLRLAAKRLALQFARTPGIGPKVIEHFLIRRYGRRVVTPRKVANYIRAWQERERRAVTVESLPWVLNLDTFNGCNLKCPFCPTGTSQLERAKARLSVDRAKRVIDLVKEHVLEIRLYNWGEPFLNPDIFEIIRYAHDAGLYTIINSNLSVKVPDLARRVVESRLDRLQASVDGLTQQTLQTYRRKSDAELVFANVRALAAERARQGAATPVLSLAFLVFRHNEHELPQLESKRREIGADIFYPRRAFIFHESFVPEHPDYQPMQAVFTGTCDYLYSELTVEATGAVSPCCANMSDQWDVGNIDQIGDLHSFWNNATYRAMRAFVGGHQPPAGQPAGKTLCEHCDLVDHPGFRPGRLSPRPPAFRAAGLDYDHGLDAGSPHHLERVR